MNWKKTIVLGGFALFFGQNVDAQWAIHVGLNEYFPIASDYKTQFPALWPVGGTVQLGGFGAGVSYRKNWMEGKRNWLFLAGVQRSRFYDDPIILLTENGEFNSGGLIGVNTHWSVAARAMPEFVFGKFSVAPGLGLRWVFASKSNYGETFVQGLPTELNVANTSVSPLVVLLPVNLNWQFSPKFGFNLRGDFFLTNGSRVHSGERAVVVFGEVSMKI